MFYQFHNVMLPPKPLRVNLEVMLTLGNMLAKIGLYFFCNTSFLRWGLTNPQPTFCKVD